MKGLTPEGARSTCGPGPRAASNEASSPPKKLNHKHRQHNRSHNKDSLEPYPHDLQGLCAAEAIDAPALGAYAQTLQLRHHTLRPAQRQT